MTDATSLLNVNREYEKAEHAIEMRRYKLAMEILQRVLADNPNDSRAHCYIARAQLLNNQLAPAKYSAVQALRLAPDYTYGHFVYAVILRKCKETRAAEREFQICVSEEPNYHHYHTQFALFLLYDKKDKARAKEHAKKALQLNPANSTAHSILAEVYRHEQQFDLAEQEYREALRLEPESFDALTGIGVILLNERNQPKEAHPFFKEALRLRPNSKLAQDNYFLSVKAKNPFYSLVWKYNLFWTQWRPVRIIIVVMTITMLFLPLVESKGNPIAEGLSLLAFALLFLFFLYVRIVRIIFFFLVKRGWLK